MDREIRVTCLRGRTSDRTDGAAAGAQALAERLGGRVIGEGSPGRPRDWSEDLPDARPVLEAAAAELSAALDQGELPVLMRLGKDALFRQQDMAFADALEFLHTQLNIAFSTEDIQEGVKAFFEKRDPVWTGR